MNIIGSYEVEKFKVVKGKYLYILKLPLKHYAVVLHDSDDETLLKSKFEFELADALKVFKEWKQELLMEA